MDDIDDPIAMALRQARQRKGLSQRKLGTLSGVPQGHISRIEAGAVDLRLTSLVELTCALELEIMLVPRQAVPAVRSILRTGGGAAPARPAYSLDEDDDA